MSQSVRQHEFVNRICRWCGGREGGSFGTLTCVPREGDASATRPMPVSIFADLSAIGDPRREIKAEEDAALAGKSEAL